MNEIIYKYRYIFVLIIFVMCVTFKINGSSLDCYNEMILRGEKNADVLLGTTRMIRSDEWNVFTPMSFSQYNNDFNYNSNVIRGDNTDVFIIYGQPVKDISMIFRIFQVGYLFLGPERGLSFFWCGRFLALFMATFEFGMLLTSKKKKLSIALALFITLGASIQWWFAINGLVEMLVFAEVGCILFKKFLESKETIKKLLYLSGIWVCIGGYVLTFYPSWMIPIAYMFLPILITILYKNRKEIKLSKKQIILCILISLIFITLLFRILYMSKDTIKVILNTEYPGQRLETGGENVGKLFESVMTFVLPMDTEVPDTNVCEYSTLFDFWPITIILLSIILFKEKKKDLCLILLTICSVFLSIYVSIGFPEMIAKITLLSKCQSGRVAQVIGVVNLFIFVRAISILNYKFNKKISIIIAEILTFIMLFVANKLNSEYVTLLTGGISGILTFLLYYSALTYNENSNKFIAISIIAMGITGCLVNPICKGEKSIINSELGKEIKKIVNEDKEALWIAESVNDPYAQYSIMFGARMINSVNVYPNIERWEKIDIDKKYNDVYNRYAHIEIVLDENYNEPSFKLLAPDSFQLKISLEDLKNKLGVKYIITSRNLNSIYNLKEIYNYNNSYIYCVN